MRFLTLCAVVIAVSTGAAAFHQDDFHMTVMDAFSMTDTSVIMTGLVEGGPVTVQDVVCLRPAEGEWRELTVDAILRLRGGREEVETAEPGTMVGLQFKGIEKTEAKAGDTLTASCG